MWTYPKCQCTKPGIWKLWISKKKVCAVCCCWGWDLVKKKNTPTKECFFVFFSGTHDTPI